MNNLIYFFLKITTNLPVDFLKNTYLNWTSDSIESFNRFSTIKQIERELNNLSSPLRVY